MAPGRGRDPLPRIVVDASVAVKWLLPEPGSDDARALLYQAMLGQTQIAAPVLLKTEVANALWSRYATAESILQSAEVITLWEEFCRIPLSFCPNDPLHSQALKIACQSKCTVYDCLEIACVMHLGAVLITADRRQAACAESLAPPIRVTIISA